MRFRSRLTAAAAAVIGIPLAVAGLAVPAAAADQTIATIENIQVHNDAGGTTFSTLGVARITVDWSLPDGTSSDATIQVQMPRNADGSAIIQATPGQKFTVTDAGQDLAECTVASDGLSLSCPISDDWLAAHPSSASGSLSFVGKVPATAPNGTYAPQFGPVTANEITVSQSTWVPPRTSTKTAGPLQDSKGQIWWYINVATPTSGWAAGQTITVTDTLGSCQSWGTLTKAQYVIDTTAKPTDPWIDVPSSSDYTVTTNGDQRTTVVTTRDAIAYRLVYTTTPTCGAEASPYENTATVNGAPVAGRWFWNTGSGTGYGTGGTFTVSKNVVGTAADQLPAGTVFGIDYSYTLPGNQTPVTGSLQVEAGKTVTSPVLPVTAIVTLAEQTPADIAGAAWAAPAFSRNGFQLSNQGTVTITLTNQLDTVPTPVDPATPVTPVTPVTPIDPVTPVTPIDPATSTVPAVPTTPAEPTMPTTPAEPITLVPSTSAAPQEPVKVAPAQLTPAPPVIEVAQPQLSVPQSATDEELAHTGSDITPVVAATLLALLIGIGALAAEALRSRRRQAAQG